MLILHTLVFFAMGLFGGFGYDNGPALSVTHTYSAQAADGGGTMPGDGGGTMPGDGGGTMPGDGGGTMPGSN